MLTYISQHFKNPQLLCIYLHDCSCYGYYKQKKSEEGTLKTHLLWQLMSDVCIQNIMKANTIKSKRKHNKRIWNPFWVCDINEGSVRHIKFILSKHSKMYKGVRSCKNQKDNKLHRIKFWIYLKIVFSSHLSE